MLEASMQAIESADAAVLLNLACGYKLFLNTIAEAPEVRALRDQVRSQPQALTLLLRIAQFTSMPFDTRYKHPRDVPLAIYLWVLRQCDLDAASLAAELVLRCANCWWAWKVAHEIRAAIPRRAERATPQPRGQGSPTGAVVIRGQVLPAAVSSGPLLGSGVGAVPNRNSGHVRVGAALPRNEHAGTEVAA